MAAEADAEDQKQSQTSEPEVVTELKRLDEQILEAKKDYEREVQKLRLQYQARQTPLLEQRDKVLCDSHGSEDPLTGTPALKGFWVTAMMNHPAFEDDIESHDIPVLEYLRTIEAEDLDKNDSDKGFRVMFHFAENPYFTNSMLTQEYHLSEPNHYNGDVSVKELKGCQIQWKAGQDVTVTKATKGGKKKKSGKEKEVPQKSFFRDHFRHLKAGDALPQDVDAPTLCMQMGDDDMEEEDMVEALLDNAHEAAIALRTQILPFAVRWYTGEAAPDESDEEEEEEEEEEEDGDPDVNVDDEDDARKAKKNEKIQQAAKDCKQQ